MKNPSGEPEGFFFCSVPVIVSLSYNPPKMSSSPSAGTGLSDLQARLDTALEKGEDRGVAVVDALLHAGARSGASDLHLEPLADRVRVRLRVDGTLVTAARLPQASWELIVARLKVQAKLVTYRRRVPQDGSLRLEIDGREVELRLSFIPSLHGEKAAIRFLSPSRAARGLSELGLSPAGVEAFRSVLAKSSGTFLVTGPAGGGKTTTLYAALAHIQQDRPDGLNIMTLEDPVERDLDGVTQTQVDGPGGVSFTSGLRAALRHDPDVLMIGEIRDRDTAEIAIQAGLTGHLVLSTIHSGTAAGVFSRLMNLEIEPFLVSAAVAGAAAQRLVRLVCRECAAEDPSAAKRLKLLPEAAGRGGMWLRGRGCPACARTGYSGRTGVFEILTIDEELRQAVLEKAPASSLAKLARARGFRSLQEEALDKARAGLTTLEEVLRLR